jgi:phosphopantothenoylcysteine decarboxylase
MAMSKTSLKQTHVVYLLLCAAPPAQHAHHFVTLLQQAGWQVCVIATPQASRWIDSATLEQQTGYPVRTDYKLPGEADPLPPADAMLVMPATFNTINKWAQGIGDTLVVSLLCEALGRGTIPLIAVPCLKMDLVRHPAFRKSITLLQECGVRVLHDPERYPSPLMVPEQEVIAVLSEMIEKEK